VNRRDLMLGGAAIALGGAAFTRQRALARQGHSPLKPEAAATGLAPLTSLLGMIPASYMDLVESNGFDWQYDDIARQFASLGLRHGSDGPDFDNEPVANATVALSHASNVFGYARVEELTTAIGFQPYGMDQCLAVGEPGRRLVLFRGEFVPDSLINAWGAAGYEPHETASGIPAWTIGTGGVLNPDHPIQSKLVSEFDNVAIIGDVLIYSSFMEVLELALSFTGSGEASIAEHPVYEPLIAALPETTVSAVGVTLPQLDITEGYYNEEQVEAIESTVAEAIDQTGSFPSVTGLVTAVEEGATIVDFDWEPEGSQTAEARDDAGTAFIRIGTPSEVDAARAVEVAVERWETFDTLVTKVPYEDLATIEARSTYGKVAALDLRQVQHPRLWLELFIYRDVLPFAAG
jgi:hypothetical protein